MKAVLSGAVLLLLASTAHAKLFRNSYVSFELPDRWECNLEGTEYVCNSLLKDAAKEAVIVLTAKEVGPSDSFEQYEQYLKTPRTLPGAQGKPTGSEVKHIRRRNIANHTWVDGMHLGSEIPNYYTRYLATIKDRIAILVTFSAHQRHFTKYSSDFFKAIESLQVLATADLLGSGGAIRPGSEALGLPGQGGGLIDPSQYEEFPDEPKSGKNPRLNLILIGIILAGVGAFIYIKFKKK